MSAAKLLWRVLRVVLLTLAAIVLLIEEWGWRPLTAWAARLATWPPLGRLEARIRRQRPGVALALFLVPAVLLFPLKLLALWLIHDGRVSLGVAVIIAAKLLGTAFVGRLFILVEPQLMEFAWFARGIAWWRQTKLRVRAALHSWASWQAMRQAIRRVADWARQRWQRFRA